MDSLTSGIKEACIQCRKMSKQSSSTSLSSSSLRRVHSIGESEASSLSPRTPKRVRVPQEETDGVASDDAASIRTRSSTTASRESLKNSPIFKHRHHGSISSYSLSSSVFGSSSSFHFSLDTLRERSESSPATTNAISKESTANLDDFIDDWFSAVTIPELPESPRSLTPSMPSFTATRHLKLSPYTYSRQHSTPNLNESRKFYTSPRLNRGPRNFVSDDTLNKVLLGDSDDSLNNTSLENLSQVSPCLDRDSPGRSGSRMIVRRSSLTGQLEHVRNPKMHVKRNSSFNAPIKTFPSDSSLLSASSYGSDPLVAKTHRKSPRPYKRRSIIVTSIETVV